MPDQEKPKEEKKEPKAKAEEKQKPVPEKAEEAPKEAASPEQKGKKISRMKLPEVESELKEVKEKMGGFYSSHARHLLARRKELARSGR